MEDQKNIPKIIYVAKDDKDKYEFLKSQEFFKDLRDPELFLLAAVYGFRYGTLNYEEAGDYSISFSRKDFTRTEYFNDEQWGLMKALAIYKKGIEILKNKKALINLLEQYAHIGIEILYQEVKDSSFDTYHYEIEIKLNKIVEEDE